MPFNIRLARALGCAAVCAAAATATSSASLIEIISDPGNSENQIGFAQGFIEYEPVTAKLTITLSNVSDPANGGYITAFLFNINSLDASASASLTSSTHSFRGIRGHAPPFGGPYPAGAAVGPRWSGGGPPSNGIGVGDTGIFVFQVAASDSASLTAMSFIAGDKDFNFVVRFRGFNDGGSDKVPIVLIPAPATMGLLAIGAVFGVRRRRDR